MYTYPLRITRSSCLNESTCLLGIEANDETRQCDSDDGVDVTDGRPEGLLVDVGHLLSDLLLLLLGEAHLGLGALTHRRVLHARPQRRL